MNYYERALELKDETIANRRHIHKNAETGLDIPKTKAYVMEKLTEYGLEPKDCGYGVTANTRQRGKGSSSESRYGCTSDAGRKRRRICMSYRKRSTYMRT